MTGLQSPSSSRNRGPILAELGARLPGKGLVLEIASGAGEHAMWAAEQFPNLTWQPTDRDPVALKSIDAWRLTSGLENLKKPIRLDAADPATWLVGKADAVVCINMVHISPWAATEGLMRGAGQVLPVGGMLFVYGPFTLQGEHIAPSNEAFDADLKARNPEWGVRDVNQLRAAAHPHKLELTEIIRMPANNFSLVFRKRA